MSGRIRVIGRDVVFQTARDSSATHEERQSGDGPHPPAVGSAHHIVKQSEGHWQAAAASVLSTFIAVDV